MAKVFGNLKQIVNLAKVPLLFQLGADQRRLKEFIDNNLNKTNKRSSSVFLVTQWKQTMVWNAL